MEDVFVRNLLHILAVVVMALALIQAQPIQTLLLIQDVITTSALIEMSIGRF